MAKDIHAALIERAARIAAEQAQAEKDRVRPTSFQKKFSETEKRVAEDRRSRVKTRLFAPQ